MNEIEVLVERTIAAITDIAQRVTRYATILLGIAAFVSIGSLLLGIAALSGASGVRALWIVLGIVFAAIAIGAAFLARWRVGAIRKDVPEMANEVRTLISEGKQNTREVIEHFQGGHHESVAGSAIVVSRRVFDLRGVVGHGVSGSAKLTSAISAIASFPGLALAALGITAVFAVLGMLFLIALAL